MQANLYALLLLAVVGVTLYSIYHHRVDTISLKRFFIALLVAFGFFLLESIFITLCYNNPITLLLVIPFLVFLSVAMIKEKKVIKEILMGLFIALVVLNLLFRSFVGDSYTTSLQFIQDINTMRKERGKRGSLKAIPLWYTSFTGIYALKELDNGRQK